MARRLRTHWPYWISNSGRPSSRPPLALPFDGSFLSSTLSPGNYWVASSKPDWGANCSFSRSQAISSAFGTEIAVVPELAPAAVGHRRRACNVLQDSAREVIRFGYHRSC